MARRIPIFIGIASAIVFCLQDIDLGSHEGHSTPSRSIAAAVSEDDGGVCGECPLPDPEIDGDRLGTLSHAILLNESAVNRGCRYGPLGRGPGTILSSLSDSLILSRPPPMLPGTV